MATPHHITDISTKFTQSSLRQIERAAGLAHSLGERLLRPVHLLHVLLGNERAKKALEQARIDVNALRTQIDPILRNSRKDDKEFPSGKIVFTTEFKQLLLLSYLESRKLSRLPVDEEEILIACLQLPEFAGVVSAMRIDTRDLEKSVVEQGGGVHTEDDSQTPTLNKYSSDLTQLARAGSLHDVIGREREIAQVIRILTRQTKSNAVLLGEAGVGKTAIVEGLAKRVVEKNVPAPLQGIRIVSLNLVSLKSAATARGRIEEILERVIDEVKNTANVVVFIDEIHTITGGDQSYEASSIANILKPSLARGELHVIGATTIAEYRKHMEKDPALSRRFEPVKVAEPDVETAIKVLTYLAKNLEQFHRVRINPNAIQAAVTLSKRYIQDRHLPDKAIDLLDETCSKAALEDKNEIVAEDIRLILAERTGIPVASISETDQQKLANLEQELGQWVIGQEEAIRVVSEAIRRARSGLKDPKRPVGSFMFLGPSGVGKTELAKVLARTIYDSEKALIRLDMSEFSESHTVHRLIGSPPGYVGYEEGGQLTNPVWDQPYSLILLDEIEKAHPKVFDIFLQVLDDGRLTDGQGRTVDFKNTIIIATSNIASGEILELAQGKRRTTTEERERFYAEELLPILKQYFRPEFINRFDEVVVFNALGVEELAKIAKLQIAQVQKRLKEEKNVTFTISDQKLVEFAKGAYNPEFGARPLKRLIQEKIENVLAKQIIEGQVQPGAVVQW